MPQAALLVINTFGRVLETTAKIAIILLAPGGRRLYTGRQRSIRLRRQDMLELLNRGWVVEPKLDGWKLAPHCQMPSSSKTGYWLYVNRQLRAILSLNPVSRKHSVQFTVRITIQKGEADPRFSGPGFYLLAAAVLSDDGLPQITELTHLSDATTEKEIRDFLRDRIGDDWAQRWDLTIPALREKLAPLPL